MTESTPHALVPDTILSNTSDGIFVLDRNRRYVMFNHGCERITGYSASEMVGLSCHCADVVDCRDRQGRDLSGALCPGLPVLQGESAEARQRLRLTTKDGRHRWVETIYTPIHNDRNEIELMLGVMRDVTELHDRENEQYRSLEALREEVERLREHMRENYGFASIVSRSPRMQVVLEKVKAACGNTGPVLILGERGTGKSMMARTIHWNGLQKQGAFISVNCDIPQERLEHELFGYARGSFPGASRDHDGLYAAADGGTLYLENIHAMSAALQERLLRAMQSRSVRSQGQVRETPADVRVIASSALSGREIASPQTLREELYYRLSVVSLEMPPLRMRMEDIPYLVDHVVSDLNRQSLRRVDEIEAGVWSVLTGHDWPGNVSELQHVIESAFSTGSGPMLKTEAVRAALRECVKRRVKDKTNVISLDDTLNDVERKSILAALRRAGGQRSLAAKLLGISRSRLYRRMDALGIAPAEVIP